MLALRLLIPRVHLIDVNGERRYVALPLSWLFFDSRVARGLLIMEL